MKLKMLKRRDAVLTALLLVSTSSLSHAFPLPPPMSRVSTSGVHVALCTAVSKLADRCSMHRKSS